MTISVGPTKRKPTHNFSLSDGTTTLGLLNCTKQGILDSRAGWAQSPMPRTAMKLAQGAAKYEDFELPFTSIIQEDFSGGMLAENFEDDTTKFRDERHCDTTRGDIICGPKPTSTALIAKNGDLEYSDVEYLDYDVAWADTGNVIACPYTPAGNITVYAVDVIAPESPMQEYAQDDILYAKIYSESAGEPDTLLAFGQVQVPGNGVYRITLNTSVNLTGSTTYWIGVYLNMGNDYHVYVKRSETDIDIFRWVSDAWVRIEEDYSLAFNLISTSSPAKINLFEHRRVLYALLSYDDGTTAPKLYMNGYRGAVLSANANLTIINTAADLSEDDDGEELDLDGKVLLLIEGPGSDEEQPWRIITSNTVTGTNDTITVRQPWKTQPTTATGWVVLGTDDWFELTGHAITKKITDVETVYDYVAIAQGDGEPIRKFRWTVADGHQYTDDGTNAFDLLLMVADTEGAMNLWGADIDDNIVDYAPAQEYGTNHTFTNTDIKIGASKYDRIRNMLAYGDPLIPYVIKDNSFGSIENDIYAEIPLGELDEVRSVYNGIAVMKYGVYLYFNLGEMIERYYDRRLDDVGPTQDEGMPEGRRGIIRKLLSYPGKYYAMLYSSENTPSILCNNGIGWHEIWRPTSVTTDGSGAIGESAPFAYHVADESGGRCNDMIIQTIPGSSIDRLWFDHDGELKWIPIAITPRRDSNYTYRDLSQFETAWIYGNLKDVNKYWHSIKLHTENLSGTGDTSQTIKVEYKVDNDTSWTVAGYIDTSPIEEVDLSSSYDVTGYRIKFRFTLHTADDDETPRILAYVVKGVIRVDVKKGWNVTIISDSEKDLNGDVDEQGSIVSQLDTWANSDDTAAPLVMRHNLEYYDNKYVFIDPASLSIQQVELHPKRYGSDRQVKEIVNFTMYEV